MPTQLAHSSLEDPLTGASINYIEVEVFAIATGHVTLRERLLVGHAPGGGHRSARIGSYATAIKM